MPIIDMTLSNPTICGYFDGVNDKAPVAELLYIHSHPAINNFLSEIEIIIHQTSLKIQMDKGNQGVVNRLAGYTRQYGALLGELNEEKAAEILVVLRDIFQLCYRILKKQVKVV